MSGINAWLLQRVSAVYLAGFLVYFVVMLLVCPPESNSDWREWMMSPAMALATALFFLALLSHAWVGIRDVLIDYVKPFGLRLGLLVLLAVSLLVMGLMVLRILLAGGT